MVSIGTEKTLKSSANESPGPSRYYALFSIPLDQERLPPKLLWKVAYIGRISMWRRSRRLPSRIRGLLLSSPSILVRSPGSLKPCQLSFTSKLQRGPFLILSFVRFRVELNQRDFLETLPQSFVAMPSHNRRDREAAPLGLMNGSRASFGQSQIKLGHHKQTESKLGLEDFILRCKPCPSINL